MQQRRGASRLYVDGPATYWRMLAFGLSVRCSSESTFLRAGNQKSVSLSLFFGTNGPMTFLLFIYLFFISGLWDLFIIIVQRKKFIDQHFAASGRSSSCALYWNGYCTVGWLFSEPPFENQPSIDLKNYLNTKWIVFDMDSKNSKKIIRKSYNFQGVSPNV